MAANIPGLPTGLPISTYDAYEQAQAAVDHLADEKFPVEHLAIVGSELRQVERVTGRLTWGKAALAGAASGAWLGLFIGLILALFTTVAGGMLGMILMSVLWGAVFFALFGLASYWASGGRRDFTSSSAIIPSTFVIYCHHQHAEDARERLARFDLRTR